ncbi:MAG: hypothetical protein EA402_00815 [Planctomycetota bacterium]|nr:MAG: hypothetical protein EA402_00815 [Planctomycetota bacterium]
MQSSSSCAPYAVMATLRAEGLPVLELPDPRSGNPLLTMHLVRRKFGLSRKSVNRPFGWAQGTSAA